MPKQIKYGRVNNNENGRNHKYSCSNPTEKCGRWMFRFVYFRRLRYDLSNKTPKLINSDIFYFALLGDWSKGSKGSSNENRWEKGECEFVLLGKGVPYTNPYFVATNSSHKCFKDAYLSTKKNRHIICFPKAAKK
mmetsp:Transcript_62419/g.73020  ORF Transcript_62419/g.73020 Transcript_62419/m.73020 type:complete len:135 (-) Transcript_62419:78-482(-)